MLLVKPAGCSRLASRSAGRRGAAALPSPSLTAAAAVCVCVCRYSPHPTTPNQPLVLSACHLTRMTTTSMSWTSMRWMQRHAGSCRPMWTACWRRRHPSCQGRRRRQAAHPPPLCKPPPSVDMRQAARQAAARRVTARLLPRQVAASSSRSSRWRTARLQRQAAAVRAVLWLLCCGCHCVVGLQALWPVRPWQALRQLVCPPACPHHTTTCPATSTTHRLRFGRGCGVQGRGRFHPPGRRCGRSQAK